LRSGALPLTVADVEGMLTAAFKGLDGSTYGVRKAVAQLAALALVSMLVLPAGAHRLVSPEGPDCMGPLTSRTRPAQAAKEDPEAAASASPAKGAGSAKRSSASRRARGDGSLSSDDMLTQLGTAFVKATYVGPP
jgi:hypothetical protein